MGISGYTFWIGRESKKLKWRTLTGPEKLLLFQKIHIPTLFPELSEATSIQTFWNSFLHLNTCLSLRPGEVTPATISDFQEKAKSFVASFISVYPTKHVTPYMHCMVAHVPHWAVVPFTQQGLEKYNDLMTKHYFRSTSHRGEQCLVQVLQKQNRIELLERQSAKRQKKREVKCSNCKEKGHKWTCSKACGINPYCSHLVPTGSSKVPLCQVENCWIIFIFNALLPFPFVAETTPLFVTHHWLDLISEHN